MRQRVAEFEGRGELAEATHRALTDQSLDLVVVRNIGEIVGKNWDSEGTPQNLEQLVKLVPEVNEATDVVNKWWQENGDQLGWGMLKGLWSVFNREQLTKPHFDPHYEIGVTFSARSDDNQHVRRYFYGLRAETPTTLIDSKKDLDVLANWHAKHRHLDNYNPSVWARHMTKVEQEPGDWVIFPNHPYPALHATSASDRQGKLHTSTRALIASYVSYSKAPSPIPTGSFPKPTIKV